MDLLVHLPYLRPNNPSSGKLLIYPGTVPVCYPDGDGQYPEELYPLPAHCVYLARRADYLGRDLILDTSNGAVTEFSSGNLSVPYDEYEALPEAEKWRAHRTLPLAELLGTWTRMYEELTWMIVPNPIAQPEIGRFYNRSDDTGHDDVNYEGGSELDREQRDAIRRDREHAAVSEFSDPCTSSLQSRRLIRFGAESLRRVYPPWVAGCIRQAAMPS